MKKAPKFGPHPPKAPNFRHALDHMALYLPPILFLARGKVQLGVLAGTAGLQAHALIAKGPCPHREYSSSSSIVPHRFSCRPATPKQT